jgi:drebrin-like protein
VFSVSAPLSNAFQQDSAGKESVLKVQSTGEGELADLIEEFSDGRIQFAYVKIKDSNTGLPKNALIAWCGEGVPERTKGYFTSHTAAVAKLLHGYHVQITARSDRDLTPDSIIQKVADASGSKYSTSSAPPPAPAATKPPVASKPAFTASQSSGIGAGFNPLARNIPQRPKENTDNDGWGADAPPVTRTQLEKVESAYRPTKVDMRSLSQQPTASLSSDRDQDDRPDVVRGAYQPVGKVDIAEIRRRAKESGELKDDRPETIKGSYEPVGKVDIAAIRSRAKQSDDTTSASRAQPVSPAATGNDDDTPQRQASLAERSAAFSQGPERLTSMPKPKVANKFGGASSFTGTKAPVPGGFEAKPLAAAAPVGTASRTFADQGGKTPAQLWAEKKARERGVSGSGDGLPGSGYAGQSPVQPQTSGNAGWQSGYSGKKWDSVQTTHTGQSRSSIGAQVTGDQPADEQAPDSPAGGISSIRDRFSGAPPMGAPASSFDRAPPPAPEPDTTTKPNRGVPMPGLPVSQPAETERLPTPPAVPRSPTPPTPEQAPASPIQVAMPVGRGTVQDAHEEQRSPPPSIPVESLSRAMPQSEPQDEEPERGPDPGRAAAQAAAGASLGQQAVEAAPAPGDPANAAGGRARAEYEYEAAEDNEVSLREGKISSGHALRVY